jgi:DNA-binding transcriptional regulator LsrR (DeoR family)
VNLNYIDENGSSVSNEIDGRMIRMSLDNIKRIDNVIIVAFGSRKLKGIKAVLRGKIADVLITDFDTAKLVVES